MAGYAIECALKAVICKKTNAGDWPPEPRTVNEMYSHDIEKLIKLADLEVHLKAEIKTNSAFAGNLGTVKEWSERSRYQLYNLKEAQDLITAISDAENGVLPWIQQYW